MDVRPSLSTHGIEWSYGEYVEPLSVHVVETDGATILVGGGDDSIADEVLSIASEYDVDVVVVEHAHVDHYGAVGLLQDELGVTVAIPARDAAALRSVGIDSDISLHPGETQWGLEAIATPGHTPGNMAFRFEDCLLAGDTVVGADSEFAANEEWQGPLAVIEPAFNTDDALARESIGRLADFDFETVLVSHGSHVRSGAETAIDQLLEDLQ